MFSCFISLATSPSQTLPAILYSYIFILATSLRKIIITDFLFSSFYPFLSHRADLPFKKTFNSFLIPHTVFLRICFFSSPFFQYSKATPSLLKHLLPSSLPSNRRTFPPLLIVITLVHHSTRFFFSLPSVAFPTLV